MNILSHSELKALMEQQSDPCISIFLPTHHKSGPEIQQDPIRFRNQLREAEYLLFARDIESTQVEALLQPVQLLLTDMQLWQHPNAGLAILRSSDALYFYQLPFSCKEQVVVSNHFYLKPLLPFLTSDQYFYILALSQNEIRLLEATHYSVKEVNLPPSVPSNLAEAMQYDEPVSQLEYHSGVSGGTIGKGGRQPLIFHGQGVGTDGAKTNILRYFRQIDRGLHEIFHDQMAPLVLAGVEFLLPIYQEANTYPHLLPAGVPGNPDKLKVRDETLCEEAWPIVEPFLLKEQYDALAQFEEYKGTDRASSNLSAIVPAAYYGRIECLLLSIDQEQWGTFDPQTSTLHLHESAELGDEDLLDLVATQTLLHGGAVHVMERGDMPDQVLLAALYRYEG